MPTIRPYDVVKAALASTGRDVFHTIPPADRTAATFHVVTLSPAQRGARPGWVERVNAAVETWVGDGAPETRKSRCVDAALDARDALWNAWQRGQRSDSGAINHIPDLPWPLLVPSGLDGVWRSRFEVQLTVRR